MILVYAENIDGTFKKSAFEAVSYASGIAAASGDSCVAISIGKVEETKLADLARFGASKIYTIASAHLEVFNAELYAKAIASIALPDQASVVVVSNTYTGKAVAPRVAAALKAGIVSGVISVPDTSNGFSVRKTVFSGKAFSDISLNTPVKVLSITPNTFNLTEHPQPVNVVAHEAGVEITDRISTTLEVSRTTGKVVLTEAEVVVSGGRGMKGPENWGMIEELASLLGAATACSKPVSDMDWRPHGEHVGQTGITIKPNLYIAVGISGAIQHLAGVSSSKVIVAINKDPEAPFFKAADYGIVGDAFDVLPKLIEATRKLKSQHT